MNKCIFLCFLVCCGSVVASEIWQTNSTHGVVWNYCHGQRDIISVTDQECICGPIDDSPFGNACAAMATAAVAVLGNWFIECDINRASPQEIAFALHNVLHMGAKTYLSVSRDKSGFAEAGEIATYLNDRERVRVHFDARYSEAFDLQLRQLPSYTPEQHIRTAAQFLVDTTTHERLPAAGVVLCDGMYSRAILYLAACKTFLLYDSHDTFLPDYEKRANGCPVLLPQQVEQLTDDEQIAFVNNQVSIKHGSFLGLARAIDDLIALACEDGRWWIGPQAHPALRGLSTVVMTIDARPNIECASAKPEQPQPSVFAKVGNYFWSVVEYAVIPLLIGLTLRKLLHRK